MPLDEQLEQILHTLQHAPQPTERYNAALWVGFQGDARAAAVLSALMQQHDDWGTRQNAAWAAGEAQLVDCVPALQAVVTQAGEDEQVRYVAALALVRLNHAPAQDYLQAHINSSDAAVRRVVAAAIHTAPYLAQ